MLIKKYIFKDKKTKLYKYMMNVFKNFTSHFSCFRWPELIIVWKCCGGQISCFIKTYKNKEGYKDNCDILNIKISLKYKLSKLRLRINATPSKSLSSSFRLYEHRILSTKLQWNTFFSTRLGSNLKFVWSIQIVFLLYCRLWQFPCFYFIALEPHCFYNILMLINCIVI